MSRLLRAEIVLPLTIVVAAIVLGASELMTTFQITVGGEPQESLLAADRHGYAQLILAICAIAATAGAIASGLRVAAIAAGVFGIAAMLLFLVGDLPYAGRVGTLSNDPTINFQDGRADPAIGFWLEAVGSVVLGLSAVAFATLRSDQLRAPLALFGRNGGASPQPGETTSHSNPAGTKPAKAEHAPGSKTSQRTAAVTPSEPTPRPPSKPSAPARRPKPRDDREATRERLAGAGSAPTPGRERDPEPKARRSLPAWLRDLRSNDG